jgi:hypothetical protein
LKQHLYTIFVLSSYTLQLSPTSVVLTTDKLKYYKIYSSREMHFSSLFFSLLLFQEE